MPRAGRAAYRIAAGQKEKRMETHILVVEDDAEIREGVAIYLKNQGYTVHGAANGARGWSLPGSCPSIWPLWM